MNKTTEQRFWEKVQKTDGCWLWTASKRNKGYGAFCYPSSSGGVIQGRAHRYSYELHIGQIPPGVLVLHACDNPACVNPAHLFLGTNQDNVDDMMAKGRHVPGGTYRPGNYKRGEQHHAAKLTPELVRTIRREYCAGGTSYSKLSAKYHMAIGAMWRVVNRKAWAHVE